MNNYLLQLLREVKTIIIPGLGALTLTNEATGEMMFMNYLKFDDGTLAKHIAEKEGIEINDASNRIAKFVREVQAEIDKGNSYDMYQFGSFKKADGEIVFEQWNSGSSSTPEPAPVQEEVPVVPALVEEVKEEVIEPVAESPVVDPEIIEVPAEPEEEEIPPVAEAAVIAAAIVEDPVHEPEVELKYEGFDTEHAPAVEPEIIPEVHETPLPVNDVPEEVKPEPNVAPSPKDAVIAKDKKQKNKDNSPLKDAKPEKKKKKMGVFAYILWGIVVLILGAGTYVAVNYDEMKTQYPILAELAGEDTLNITKVKPMMSAEDTLVETPEEPVAPEAAPEPEPVAPEEVKATPAPAPVKPVVAKPAPKPAPVVTKPVAVPKPAPKPVVARPVPVKSTPRPVSSGKNLSSITIGKPDPAKPFHVIGGSFSSEANAQKFARSLISKGRSSVVVGEFNGMHRVSLASFATKEEAVAALPNLNSVVSSAWVFKWP